MTAESRRSIDSPDAVVACVVFFATVLLLALTASQGFVRDEGYYFRAAHDYHGWFERLWSNLMVGRPFASFSDAELTRSFGYNTEHPGFAKIMMGWTWKVFHVWLEAVPYSTGFRLASMMMVAAGNAFLYLLGSRMMSRGVGLLAVVLFMASPRVFYHAHLACFDGPIVGLTVVVTYAFWRSLDSRGWIWISGLAWGVAVATKHNAVFLLPTLGLAWVLARVGDFRIDGSARLSLPPLPLAFVAMAVIGPILFYVFYPYGWHDPIGRIAAYYSYHLHHEHYPVDYFDTLYTKPPFPWSFPFGMSALTVPLTILVPGTLGLVVWGWRGIDACLRAWRRLAPPERPAVETWLIVVSTLIPPLIIAVPSVPIFGGTKHWMTMMPFFCLLAAWTVVQATQQLGRWPSWGRGARVGLVAAVILLPLAETARTHPLGHTYFNELAGGHQGGAALGMPRTFWGGDARSLLPILNEEAERGATVFTDRMNQDDFNAYQKEGLLRSDLRWISDPRKAKWAFINHQREYQDNEYAIWATIGDERPRAVTAFDGVPIVSLYRVLQGRTLPDLRPGPAAEASSEGAPARP